MTNSSPHASSLVTIQTAQSGFYEGFNRVVALSPKILIGLLIFWAGVYPEQAGEELLTVQNWTNEVFGAWYIYVAAFYLIVCLLLSLWPATGRVKLGKPDERPEFSTFSWFAMMFGAGIGVGMLTYSTAEPIFHFAQNPDTIKGIVDAQSAENVRNAYKWAFLHYGLTPWGCYGIIGMSLAYFSYNRGMPLTIRSALQPLFGRAVSGPLGHIVDIVAILATVIGVGVTIGYGVSQFASGVFNITGAEWMTVGEGKPTLVAQLMALVIIMLASTGSAMSGINRGIKWLSNLNMGLSFFLLAFFAVLGATLFAFKAFFIGIWDYIRFLPEASFTVWSDTSTEVGQSLVNWQNAWSIFYWAWWIAFAPFVGLFLARVSRGRSIREYVLGAMIVPSIMCFTWFALVGGTAIDLELNGVAQGSIINADISAQLFRTINLMLSPELAIGMSIIIVVLLSTYLVTSADSAILIINTLASAGNESPKHAKHIAIWGIIFTAVIAALLAAGGMGALRSAMIIGALPFSLVMALMGISLIKVLVFKRD
ncbi:MAG: BCCT family transporter [Gammaproteobacteria bacterium]|nr:BCCT family transporter [Gammaproteobacteria bacterium]